MVNLNKTDNTNQLETAAKAVYVKFAGAEDHPWVPGGNSDKQYLARDYAAAALSTLDNTKGEEGECGCDFYYVDDIEAPTPEYVYKWKAIATAAIAAGTAAIEIFANSGGLMVGMIATMVVWWS